MRTVITEDWRPTPAQAERTEAYLDSAEAHGYTPGTWLSRTLRGKAKRYMSSYERPLLADLVAREGRGEIIRVRSARGGIAWVRAQQALPVRGGDDDAA
jgi:hypothetical protein